MPAAIADIFNFRGTNAARYDALGNAQSMPDSGSTTYVSWSYLSPGYSLTTRVACKVSYLAVVTNVGIVYKTIDASANQLIFNMRTENIQTLIVWI